MKKQIITIGAAAMAVVLLFPSCKQGGSWQTDEKTGVRYILISHSDKGVKPTEGGVATVMLFGTSSKDSVIWDSRKNNRDTSGTYPIPVKHTFHGCLEEGLMLMN